MINGMPDRRRKELSDGIPKPRSLKDVPRYLKELICGFFTRLFYIISLVWRAAPFLLVSMILLCVVDGVLPVPDTFHGSLGH